MTAASITPVSDSIIWEVTLPSIGETSGEKFASAETLAGEPIQGRRRGISFMAAKVSNFNLGMLKRSALWESQYRLAVSVEMHAGCLYNISPFGHLQLDIFGELIGTLQCRICA